MKMATESEKMDNAETQNVLLSKSLGGGPHGVGDPEDRSLRRVEKEIMIPQKMKIKAKQQKCADKVKAGNLAEFMTQYLEGNVRLNQEFGICAKEQGFLMPFKCREEAKDLRLCLESSYHDKEFVDLCTKEYLDERSEYRRTGIKTHDRNKQAVS